MISKILTFYVGGGKILTLITSLQKTVKSIFLSEFLHHLGYQLTSGIKNFVS